MNRILTTFYKITDRKPQGEKYFYFSYGISWMIPGIALILAIAGFAGHVYSAGIVGLFLMIGFCYLNYRLDKHMGYIEIAYKHYLKRYSDRWQKIRES